MKKLITLVFGLSVTACATAPGTDLNLPDSVKGLVSNQTLACRFEKRVTNAENPKASDWYFWRQDQRTESKDDLSNQGEIWERNAKGQLFYTRIFFTEQVALEFTPGDLAATGTTSSWPTLYSLVNPANLGKELALTSKEQVNGLAVEHYQGVLNGIATEVAWLPKLLLPARISRKEAQGLFALTLSDCGDPSRFAVKPMDQTRLNQLRRLDYTDLGDMESDPLVHHLEELMGQQHEH